MFAFELALEVVEDLACAPLTIARRHDRFAVEGVVVDPQNFAAAHIERVVAVLSGVSRVFRTSGDCAEVSGWNHSPVPRYGTQQLHSRRPFFCGIEAGQERRADRCLAPLAEHLNQALLLVDERVDAGDLAVEVVGDGAPLYG